MDPPVALRAESVNLTFRGEMVVRDVNFSVARGEIVAILGPSGCGKTSLLRMVAGLEQPGSGRLEISPTAELAPPRIGYVFQDATLLPWRNVVDNVHLPLELAGTSAVESKTAIARVLAMVRLRDEDRWKYPRMLSGGMRMRVSLARALVRRPEILLLDEPFAALDDLLRQQLNEELLELWYQEHWTILFVTHNVNEAAFLSQQILVMSDRPGTISHRVSVPFPYPRTKALRSAGEFAEFTGQISRVVRERVS